MKTPHEIFRWTALVGIAFSSFSCMTTYDSSGRPVRSVDPTAAVAGAAAAGLVGYAIANDDDKDKNRHHRYDRRRKDYNKGYRDANRDDYRYSDPRYSRDPYRRY